MRVNETELIEKSKKGDLQSFERLVILYQRRIFGFVNGRIGNRSDVEEIVQEAMLRVFVNLQYLRAPSCFRSWLYGITANCIRRHIGLENRNRIAFGVDVDDLADQGESCREWEDYEAAVAPAILGLSPEQEAVVRLRYFAGLSYREIGIMCDIGVRLVKSRLHEAKQVLRKTIPDHYRGNNVPQYILKRSKEKIMRTLDLIVKAAYVIRALSLNHQILVCRCAKEGARLDEEVLTAVSGIRNGKEVIEGFEGRFTIEDLVRIFGSSRTLENWIIENLDERDPALSEEFKSRMFVFEDIVLLPPDAVRKILAKVPAETMVTAMLSCFKELKLYVMSFFEKEERNELLGKIPELETDKKNVDAAQFEVVRIIAQMEASKEIAVRRPADFEETMRKHLAMQNVRTG